MTDQLPDPSAGPVGDLPEQAVEAAAKVIYEKYCTEMGHTPCWDEENKEYRTARMADVRPLLTAAVPLIRAHIADELRAYALPEWLVKGTVGIRMQREIVLDCADFVARVGGGDGYCVCDDGPMLDCGISAHRAAARVARGGTDA